MKKFFIPLLVLTLLCGCASESVPAETTARALPPEPTPTPYRIPTLTDAQSEAMANAMNAGRALIADGVLYTFDFDSEYRPVLASYALTADGLGERKILAEDCVPQWLTRMDGKLYFTDGTALLALDTADGAVTTLCGDCSGYLSAANGALWFCDAEGKLCRVDPANGERETVLDKSCFYPYVLGDTVFYQDDADGETLHVCSLADGSDERLTDIPAYEPVIVGNALWFWTDTEDGLRPAVLDEDGVRLLDGYYDGLRSHLGGEWKLCGAAEARDKGADYELTDFTSAEYEVRTHYHADARILGFSVLFADGESFFYGDGSIS